jgi:8-oxo-dGTP pyrophosphatase MutT (NUDIX family)
MSFDDLLMKISHFDPLTLPGAKAHNLVMGNHVRDQIFKDVRHKEDRKQAAVLALLYPDKNQQARMVFILRKTYNGHHSGQISFPGGKQETFDKTHLETALRETEEEIGVSSDQIDIKAQLSSIFIPISNFQVQPFLGVSHQTLRFKIDPVEVEEVLPLSFDEILNNPLQPINHTYFDKTYTLKAFQVGGFKIWGATAMILSEIVTLFKN